MRVNSSNIKNNLIFNGYQKIYENTVSSPTTSITISSLDGDSDGEYLIITRFVSNAASTNFLLRPNNDSGANYGSQFIYGQSATATSTRLTGSTSFVIGFANSSEIDVGIHTLHTVSGYPRVLLTNKAQRISTTTITAVDCLSNVWNNTANNITSLVISSDTASGIGTGSFIAIFRRIIASSAQTRFNSLSVPVGKLYANSIETIYENTLTSDSSTLSITGLSGDTDIFYELEYVKIHTSTSGSMLLRINSDSGSNYGYQTLKSANATITAARSSSTSLPVEQASVAANEITCGKIFIYAKSGYVRTGICMSGDGISTTTITSEITQGFSWNNSANSITSIDLSMSAGQLKTGSYFRLKAYRKST